MSRKGAERDVSFKTSNKLFKYTDTNDKTLFQDTCWDFKQFQNKV